MKIKLLSECNMFFDIISPVRIVLNNLLLYCDLYIALFYLVLTPYLSLRAVQIADSCTLLAAVILDHNVYSLSFVVHFED